MTGDIYQCLLPVYHSVECCGSWKHDSSPVLTQNTSRYSRGKSRNRVDEVLCVHEKLSVERVSGQVAGRLTSTPHPPRVLGLVSSESQTHYLSRMPVCRSFGK